MTGPIGVIGAGAHGVCAAHHLARRGADVVVFDRGAVASGPTGQASGVVRAYYTNAFLAEIAHAGVRVLAELPESGYRRTGGLYLHGAQDVDDVHAAAANLARLGIAHRVLEGDALADAAPSLDLTGVAIGVWEDEAGYADPRDTTRAIAARAAELGARLLIEQRVVALRETPGGVTVVLRDGTTHEVDRLLVAAGPWTAPLLLDVGVDLPLTAERHVVAVLVHAADAGASAADHVLIDVPGGYYSRPRAREELLLGALAPSASISPNAIDSSLTDDEHAWLAARAAVREPVRARARRGRGWASLYDVSPDWQPVIGQVTERVFVDAGTSGHGFKLAPALGDHVARLLLDDDPDERLAQLHPNRFTSGAPLASGFGAARILG